MPARFAPQQAVLAELAIERALAEPEERGGFLAMAAHFLEGREQGFAFALLDAERALVAMGGCQIVPGKQVSSEMLISSGIIFASRSASA